MSMNPLPPQAYTKDTLIKAYQWIQMQPERIRELATTPDVLVSLYQKAKLQGESALERPSIQNFKSELKNLAGQLGEFAAPAGVEIIPEIPVTQTMPPPQANSAGAPLGSATRIIAPSAAPGAGPSISSPESVPVRAGLKLDEKSEQYVTEIRLLGNLTRDEEALRLLIAAGYKQLKDLLR